jgi:thioredoxin-related protein
MKITLLSLAFLSLTSLGFAQEKGIRFEQNLSWGEVKAKAKAEKKYIFMDVFATWCVVCKRMDKEVYTTEKIGTFMNDKFISVKVQANPSNEDSEDIKKWYKDAEEIVRVNKVGLYPSFLYFSPEGKLVNSDGGFKSPEEFLSSATSAVDSSRNFANKEAKFNGHQMDFAMMPEFAKKAKDLNRMDLAQKVANEYINGYLFKLKGAELYTKENLSFMGDFLGDENSKGFKLFMKEPEKVNAVLGDYAAQSKVRRAIYNAYIPKGDVNAKRNFDWNSLEKTMAAKFGSVGQEEVYLNAMFTYYDEKDQANFGKYYVLYYEKALKHPVYDVNNITWRLFEQVEDQKVLKFACDVVMKYAIEKWYQNDPTCWDTYANLLYKAGQTTLAIEWEEKASKMKIGMPDEKVYTETLDKMRKGLPTWPTPANN